MGIALIALTSLSQPVKALTQFLGGPVRHKSQPLPQAVGATQSCLPASATAAPDDKRGHASPYAAGQRRTVPEAATAAAGTAMALPTSTGALKPFGVPRTSRRRLAGGIRASSAISATTVKPSDAAPPPSPRPAVMPWMNAPAALTFAAPAANADCFHPAGTPVRAEASDRPARPAAPRPLLRVLRRVQVGDPARLVISGRMADVCAELDRLVASEARLAL